MKNYILASVFLVISLTLFAQQTDTKKVLDTDAYKEWQRIEDYNISNNGNWSFYLVNNIKEEDSKLYLYNYQNKKVKDFNRAEDVAFASDNSFIAFLIKPHFDTIRQLKLDKAKKNEFPNDTLAIYLLQQDSLILIPDVDSYQLAEENSGTIVYEVKKKSLKVKIEDEDAGLWKKIWNNNIVEKKKSIKDLVYVFNPISNTKVEFDNVKDYDFSHFGNTLAVVKEKKTDSLDQLLIKFHSLDSSVTTTLIDTLGNADKINLNRKGDRLAVLISLDTLKKNKVYSLYEANLIKSNIKRIADTLTFKELNYSPSINKTPFYSRDGSKLYYGVAPTPEVEEEDTLLKSEKYSVDVWNYNDGLLQTQQKKYLRFDKRKTFTSVWHVRADRNLILADSVIESIRLIDHGNSSNVIGVENKKYERLISWDGWYSDYYLINSITGEKIKFLEKFGGYNVHANPNAKFVVYFSKEDSNWYSYNVQINKHLNLTEKLKVNFYNEEDDTPDPAGAYGFEGFSKDGKSVFIKDRYDIWKINMINKKAENITSSYGRKNNIRFNALMLEYEQKYLDEYDYVMLKAFNDKNKRSGYYKFKFDGENRPLRLIMSKHSYSYLTKAKDADKILWRRMNFKEYYNLYHTDINFLKINQVSNLNLQQKDYKWGSVELVKWTAYDSTKLEGLLYKPEDFDTTKQYPMIVYFYEKYSDRLYTYHSPKPSHSTINFSEYVSNGYIVFVPDIVYTTGEPGESAYNCIISGTEELMKKPWVNKDKIGIQGQSWGGYQVAYLVTRTNIFAAAESGAPVSNMTSAYGGIRWGTGMSRAFQYEQGQSRIGADLWSDRDAYIRNSPLFFADKVETPLLIMHNDKDGAVPWYQGIEYFSALRRLDKKVWMLTYNDDGHNLMKWPNRVDLTIRMQQFFDHYLKDKPMPIWMSEGIPAIKKGEIDGYKLIEE